MGAVHSDAIRRRLTDTIMHAPAHLDAEVLSGSPGRVRGRSHHTADGARVSGTGARQSQAGARSSSEVGTANGGVLVPVTR